MKKMQEKMDEGKREVGELLWPTWILALHSIALILFSLSLPLARSLPPSSCSLSPFLSFPPVFLALTGHAAAAELFGSLDFMFAALLIYKDGVVNLDLHWCGEN